MITKQQTSANRESTNKNLLIPVLLITMLFISVISSAVHAEDCCVGIRGNIDNSPDDVIDISDLVFMVDYQFRDGDVPACFEEADLNGSGNIDIEDLVYMVDYQFRQGDIPPACPLSSDIIFNDDFSGTAGQLPASDKWDYDIGTDWGNAQLEYDTDRPVNVSLDGNGNLAIIARAESYMGQPYTSARIVTRDLVEFTYGRVEARIKLPYGQGIWPAFWLLGADIDQIGWPSCGEIDIMEYLGHETNKVYGTVHGPGYSGGAGIGTSFTLPTGNFDDDFHIFAVEWVENEIRWYVDDVLYQTLTPTETDPNEWVFDHPFYIILNVAVGGNWPGAPDGTTVFPQTMLIDYVRVIDLGTLLNEPVEPAPTPTVAAGDVISIFSDAYTNINVDTWSADWDDADVEDFVVATNNIKKYSNLVYAGIEFVSTTIDASAMTHLHLDLWTPDAVVASDAFKVKLVDFGANGVWDGGGDDVEHELSFSDPILSSSNWVSLDISLTDFSGLTTKGHLAQLIISGAINTVYVDNIYLYNSNLSSTPQTSAPTPTYNSSNVISLFSDSYSDVPVETWSAFWDVADVSDYNIGADDMKMYTALTYAGIEFKAPTIDAGSMTHFRIDVWTPDATNAPAVFKVKLVDFGANGVWDENGDDVEHELIFDQAVMNTGSWVTLDIPLTDFTGLITKGHLGQLVISGDPNTVFVDNVLFHR